MDSLAFPSDSVLSRKVDTAAREFCHLARDEESSQAEVTYPVA